jgi:hypothetical protein
MPSLTFYFCWQKMDQSNWQTFNQLKLKLKGPKLHFIS